MELSLPLHSTPFRERETNFPDLGGKHQVSIAGRGYMVNLKGYQHTTIETRRAAQDTTNEPGESSLTISGFWVRSATDWTLGAGQRRFDNDNDASRRRFVSSKGTDGWVPGELKLLNDTELVHAATANVNLFLLSVNNFLYMVNGTDLDFTSDLVSFSTASGTDQINAITTDGVYVYVATPSGIFRAGVGSTTLSLFSTFGCDQVAYANGRLIATKDNRVVEVSAGGVAGGAGQLDDTSRVPSFTFSSILSAPNGIYLGGYSGDRSAIYFTTNNPQTGELLPLVWAGAPTDGVRIQSMNFYGGALFVGSDIGFQLFVVSGNDAVVPGKVVLVPGGVAASEGQGDFIWFSWSDYDASSTGLGRAGLGEFTEAYVAAYSSDLMAAAQGDVPGVATFQDKRVFSVTGVGLFAETDELVASGSINSGEVQWTTVIQKSTAGLDMRHLPLNGTIEAALLLEDGVTVMPVGDSTLQGNLTPPRTLELFDAEGEVVSLILTLNRDATDSTLGPILRRWSMSAFIRPHRQDHFVVPVRLFSRTTTLEGAWQDYDTRENFNFLKSLEGSGEMIEYREGDTPYRVQVDMVSVTDPDKWNDKRSFFDAEVIVEMTSQEPGL